MKLKRRMVKMKYRKKPVVIEAFKLGKEYPDWFADKVSDNTVITCLSRELFISHVYRKPKIKTAKLHNTYI